MDKILSDVDRVIRNHQILDEVGSDELPAKYDRARELGLPPPVAMYADNKALREKPNFDELDSKTLGFLADDPVRCATFKDNDARTRLNEAFVTGGIVNRQETPQVRYGRVADDVYGNGLATSNRVQLEAAGWSPDSVEKDVYFHQSDGRRVYRPVLKEWLEGPVETKIGDAAEKMLPLSHEDLAAIRAYDRNERNLKDIAGAADPARLASNPARLGAGDENDALGMMAAAAGAMGLSVKPDTNRRAADLQTAANAAKRALVGAYLRSVYGEEWNKFDQGDDHFFSRMGEVMRKTGIDTTKFKPSDFAELGVADTDPSALFNYFGILSLRESAEFERRLESYRSGAMNSFEKADFEREVWQRQFNALRGDSDSKRFVEGLATSIGEMVGFGISAGAAKAGGAWGLRKLGVDLAAKSGIVGKVAKMIGLAAGEEAVRTTLYQPEFIAAIKNDQTQTALRYNEESGLMELDMTPQQELAVFDSYLRAVTKRYFINSSERMGALVPTGKVISSVFGRIPQAQRQAVGRMLGNQLVNRMPVDQLRRFGVRFRQFKDVTHFNGMIGEHFEEEMNPMLDYGATQLGEMMNVKGWSSIDQQSPFMGQREREMTVLSVATLCGLLNVPNAMIKVDSYRRNARMVDMVNRMRENFNPEAGTPPASRAVASDAANLMLTPQIAFNLPAREFRALFQSTPDLQTAFDFTEREMELINTRADENAVIELPASRLIPIRDKAHYQQVADLVLGEPGGVTLSDFSRQPDAVTGLNLSPEARQAFDAEMEQLEGSEGERREFDRVAREKIEAETQSELDRIGEELSSRYRKTQIDAQLTVVGNIARTIARSLGKPPAEVLRGIRVAATRYAEFAGGRSSFEDVPFQAITQENYDQLRETQAEAGKAALSSLGTQHEAARAMIRRLVEGVAQNNRDVTQRREDILPVSERQAGDVNRTIGENISGFRHEITPEYWNRMDEDLIRKNQKYYKNKNFHLKNNIFTPSLAEMELIPLILDQYDNVAIGDKEARPGVPMVKFTKDINGWRYFVEEEVRGATKTLSLRRFNVEEIEPGVPGTFRQADPRPTPEATPGSVDIIPQNDPTVKEQSAENRKKGAFDPVSGAIHLFEAADLSTFSHEAMHYFFNYLEMLDADGMLEGTQLKEDLAAIRAFSTREDGTFDHEKLPKAFEYYLKKGVAPTAALQAVFGRFRDWLTKVYNTVKDYFDANPLPVEIKEVFDRWVSSDAMADRILSDDAFVDLQRQAGLLGVGTATRGDLLPWAEKSKSQIMDTLERLRTAGRYRAMAEARRNARKGLETLPVYQLRAELFAHGKLDAAAVKSVFGAAVLKELRARGVIAKTPRAARPGEEFHDPQDRRGREIANRQYRAAFDEYLYSNHYIAWLIRGNNYGRIKPDPKFGIMREQCGSFFDLKKGQDSDLAARELSLMAGYEISEQELIDALSDLTYREIRKNFNRDYRDNKAHWDAMAEADLQLVGQQEFDRIAAEHGFSRGSDMIEALRKSPTEPEFVEAAAALAGEKFDSEFPASESYAAADASLEWLDNLVAALAAKASPDQARLSKQALRDAVSKMTDKMSMASAVRVDLRRGAVERNAREVAAAMKKGDWTAALEAAKRLHLNCAMLAEQQRIRTELSGIPRRVKQTVKRHRQGDGRNKVAGDVFYYYRRLARDFGFTADTLAKVTEPGVKLDAILANSGMDISMDQIPEVKDYRELTVGEFSRLYDFMTQIYRYGLDLVRNAEDGRTLRMQQDRTDVIAALSSIQDRGAEGGLLPVTTRFASDSIGNFQNLLHFCRRFDGYLNITGEGVGGVFERLAYNVLHRSDARNSRIVDDTVAKLKPSIDYFLSRFRELPAELLGLPEFSDQHRRFVDGKWTPEMALGVALSWGNVDNRSKLLAGYGWNADQMQSVLAVFDRADDWKHIQSIWDSVDSLYPELNAVYKRVNYHDLTREEPDAFAVQTKDGGEIAVKGGYMPIRYDGRLLFGRNGEFELNLDQGTARRSAPASGMTQDRAAYTGMAVELSLDGLVRHVTATARYIAFKESSREVMAIFDHADVQREITAKFGDKAYRTFREHLVNAINPDTAAQHAFFTQVKRMLTASALWFNLVSATKQMATMFNGIASVGGMPVWSANAARFAANPFNAIREVNELSQFMKERSRARDRDIKDEVAKITRSRFKRAMKKLRNAGFLPINIMDRCAVYPMWMASYQHALNRGYTQDDAVLIADKHVADTQGSNREMDTTAMQRAQGFGLFLMYVGPTVAQSNRIFGHTMAALEGRISAGRYGHAMLTDFLIPAMMVTLINAALMNELDDLAGDDDDKRNKAWLKLLGESGSIMLAGIPLARELPRILEGRLPNHPASAAIRMVSDPFKAVFVKRDDDGNVMPEEILYQTVKSASIALGLPVPGRWEQFKRIRDNWTEE